MKQITLREFQLHPSKYLEELPLVLTRVNIPIAIVNKYSEQITATTFTPAPTTTPSSDLAPVETPAALLKPICEAGRGLCRARSIGKYRLIADGVDEKVENLCSIHFAKAKREPGVEVKEL